MTVKRRIKRKFIKNRRRLGKRENTEYQNAWNDNHLSLSSLWIGPTAKKDGASTRAYNQMLIDVERQRLEKEKEKGNVLAWIKKLIAFITTLFKREKSL